MSIVSCPRCGDKVSVPPAASPSALVECPLCCEEYFLSDALIQLPPLLKVVGGRAASTDSQSDYALAEPATAGVSAAVFDTTGGDAATIAPRPQLRTVSRPRPQEKSTVGEIIKVVLGGVAGLAGGLLVLWWGFGVDVGVGSKISQVEYLRWIVPEKFWDETVLDGNQRAELETREPSAGSSGQASSKKKQPSSEDSQLEVEGGFFGGKFEAATSGDSPVDKEGSAVKSSAKKADDDPLLILDPLEIDAKTEVKPATKVEDDLKIDVPLKALPANSQAPSEKKPTNNPPEENPVNDKPAEENKPAEKVKSTEPAPPEPIPAKGADEEKPEPPTPPKSTEPADDPDKPENDPEPKPPELK